MAQFIKIGTMVFNVRAINAVNLDDSDGYINVFTSDCTDYERNTSNVGYQLPVIYPETHAFIAWLTDPDRCIDVMEIPGTDVPNIIDTPSGIRFEV